MTVETASLVMKVQTDGANRATRELDAIIDASDKVEQNTEKATKSVKQFGIEAQNSAARMRGMNAALDTSTSALDKIQSEYNSSRLALQSFLAEQVKAGRTVDENGNVFTAHGVRAAKLSDEYKSLRLNFVNAINSNDKLADSMLIAASATDKNQLAVTKAAEKQRLLDDAAEDLKQTIVSQTAAIQKSNTPMVRMGNDADLIAKRTAAMGRKVAQTSIQVEQLISSIAAGANPTQAFAFQLADIGIVLGAPLLGAIAGITTSIGGPFIASLLGGEEAADALANTIERLNSVATRSDGVVHFTDSIRELAEVSEIAARARIDAAIINAQKVAELSSKAITESMQDALDLDGFFADLEGAVASARAFGDRAGANLVTGVGRGEANAIADKIGESFGFAKDEARAVGVEIVELIANLNHPVLGGAQAFQALEDRLSELSQASGRNRDKMLLMVGALSEFFDEGRKASKTAEDLQRKLDELSSGNIDISVDPTSLNDAQGYIVSIASSLAVAELKLNGAQEEAFKLSSAISAGFSTFEQMPEAAQALTSRMYEVNAAQEEQNRLLKEQEDARREMGRAEQTQSRLLASLDQQIIAYKDGAQAAYEYGVAQQLGLETAEKIPQHIQKQIDKLYELKDAQEEFSWTNWLESAQENLTNFDELSANTIDNFSQRFGTAFEQIIFDSENLGDVFDGLLSGMARSTVNAIGQMIAQWAAYELVQMAVGKTAAVQGAGAMIAEAQAASLMAGIHAFSSTAAIPVHGPALAPAAMGSALSVTQPMAAGVATIATGMIAGAREFGGPVSAGVPYKVGEAGEELFVPNQPGQIITNNTLNKVMNGEGSQEVIVNLNVINEVPNVKVEYVTRDQVNQIVISQMGEPTSDGFQAMQRRSNLTPAASY